MNIIMRVLVMVVFVTLLFLYEYKIRKLNKKEAAINTTYTLTLVFSLSAGTFFNEGVYYTPGLILSIISSIIYFAFMIDKHNLNKAGISAICTLLFGYLAGVGISLAFTGNWLLAIIMWLITLAILIITIHYEVPYG